MMRRWRSIAVALVLIAVAGWFGRSLLERGEVAPRYRTEKVSRGDLVASVTATGTVNPVKTVQVGTYVSGPIQAIDVDYNSPVTKNQRVAKIDPRPFALRVQQSEAGLANARAALAKARADLEYKSSNLVRNRKLQTEGIVAADAVDVLASSVDQARAEVAVQQAQVQQAEAQLEEARVNLGYTDIVSPVDGVVVSRAVDVGQTVAASFQTPTLFVIAEDLTKMQVNANVSEADIGEVREGQSATFTVDAFPERSFSGTVSQVRNSPLNVQNVITYDVVIDAANADLALRPGMTANVDVVTGRREQALRVPTAALRFRPPSQDGDAVAAPSGAAVWRLTNSQPEPIAVTPGLADDSYTEVQAAALHEGDAVIVSVERAKTQAEGASTQRPPGFNVGGGGGRRR
ncbi:MAG: efflux RND transporter periplasmic adaptor subunit [Candidatus Binatia bacterium]